MAKNDGMINEWNEAWRTSPHYTDIMMSIGVDPTKPIKLTDEQRKIVQSRLEEIAGKPFDKGLEIDPAGNMNQNEGFGKQAKRWGPLAGGIALTLFGIPGVMPGVLTAGGGAAAGAAGAAGGAGAASAGGGATAGAAGATGAAGGIWGAIRGALPAIVGTAGRALASGADASAHNRGVQLDASMEANKLNQQAHRDWYNQMVERETTGRDIRNDSWKALQQGDYVENWKPSGQKFSPYTRDLVAPSDAVREAGAARAADARSRLTGYSLPTPERQGYTLDPKLTHPGVWEQLQGYLGAGLEGVSGIWNPSRPRVNTQTQPAQPTVEDAFRFGFNF
jgi:hypothetical protein